MKNVVVFKPPVLAPLPPAVVEHARTHAVTLPLRFEKARQAMLACEDLSELLDWSDQMAAINAAAKAAKLPDLARSANRGCKEGLLRLGQLLNRYNGASSGGTPSERAEIIAAAGISHDKASAATRLASAPSKLREAVLADDQVTATAGRVHGRLRRDLRSSRRNGGGRPLASEAYACVMRGNATGAGGSGLCNTRVRCKSVQLHDVRACTPDEKIKIRAVVREIMELLDAIDEAAT